MRLSKATFSAAGRLGGVVEVGGGAGAGA